MKKTLIVIAGLTLAVVLVIGAAPAYAADLNRGGPEGSPGRGGGNDGAGYGQQGEAGTGTGIPLELDQNINLESIMDEQIHINLASTLGLTVEELESRMEAGETFADIAISLGYDVTAVSDMLAQARSDALAQAVADGSITQEQADWVASHGNQTPAASYGDGVCLEDCLAVGQGQHGRPNR